jgi:hypothetical protein
MSTVDGAEVSERARGSTVRRLQSSWNHGLSELLTPRQKTPHPWKLLLFHTERETLIYGSQKSTPLGRFNADDDAAHLEPLKAEVRRLAKGPKAVRLRLAPELVFDHRLRIPAGTLDVAAAIVCNQVERISPWPEAETVHGYEIEGRDLVDGTDRRQGRRHVVKRSRGSHGPGPKAESRPVCDRLRSDRNG